MVILLLENIGAASLNSKIHLYAIAAKKGYKYTHQGGSKRLGSTCQTNTHGFDQGPRLCNDAIGKHDVAL